MDSRDNDLYNLALSDAIGILKTWRGFEVSRSERVDADESDKSTYAVGVIDEILEEVRRSLF